MEQIDMEKRLTAGKRNGMMNMLPAALPSLQQLNNRLQNNRIGQLLKIEAAGRTLHFAAPGTNADICITVLTGKVAADKADENLPVTDQITLPLY